jgi:pimeloyl-ACP methyl ester carboxylesterase
MRVSNDDVRIDVRVDGNGDDAIVLLHGFPLTREIWNETIPALAQRRRVVSVDLRGMGKSSVTAGPYLMETLAGDVAAVLDALALPRATIVGHSLGGYVALAFARMYTERVSALALVCSKLGADTPERAQWRYELADDAQKTQSIARIVDEMIPTLLAQKTLENKPEIVQRVRAIASQNSPDGLAAMLRGMAVRDAADDIAPELEMPVLLVAGRHDKGSTIEEAQTAARVFPNGRLVVCEESAHLPMVEEPEVVARALAGFPS